MPSPKIRTLLIDDCQITCTAFGVFLRRDAEIELIGTAFGGEEGIAKARQLTPDVIVTDVDMPGCDGVNGCADHHAGDAYSYYSVEWIGKGASENL